MIKSSKVCAGLYKITDGENTVTITRVEYPNDGIYWIASADWDMHRFSDPLYTKREAVLSAKYILANPVC